GLPRTTDAGDRDGNLHRQRLPAPQHRAKRRTIAARALPRMFLLRAHRLFADRIAIHALNRPRRFITRLDANLPLRQIHNIPFGWLNTHWCREITLSPPP